MQRKTKYTILFAGALSLALTVPAEKYFDIAKNLDIFATLFRELNVYYVDEVEPKILVEAGIRGMLESLDPYTDFIPEEDLEAFTIQTTGEYAGIGALVSSINEKCIVTHPYENFPAHRAGIRVGDEVISVNGKAIKGGRTDEVSLLLKGNPQSEVTLVVLRQGKEHAFTVTRERIKITNVSFQDVFDENIGYIKLDDFTPEAANEVEEALHSLKQKGATSIILDIRDNPGGLLYEAVNIVNLFVPKGLEIVATRGKIRDWNKSYSTLNPPIDLQIPVVVLINEASASASEIVAGGLQDYDRALLLGQKTFGKGLVQSTRPLAYNAHLKITTAKYYIPSGRCIQALDYAHRKKDGTVEKFADSVKSKFFTKNKRAVYDGGGLDPDISVTQEPYGPVVRELAQSGLIFEYAAVYSYQHPNLTDMKKFQLTDEEYQEFEAWLNSKNFVYTSDLEKKVSALLTDAKEAQLPDNLQTTMKAMKNKIVSVHSGYLARFRDEIQPILEEEIGFHVGLLKGRTTVALRHDKQFHEAIRILKSRSEYEKLLMPH